MRNVMFKKRSPEVPSTAPLMKDNSFLTGHRLAVQRKKKKNKGHPLEQISSAAFSRLLSLSRGSERALTDTANDANVRKSVIERW